MYGNATRRYGAELSTDGRSLTCTAARRQKVIARLHTETLKFCQAITGRNELDELRQKSWSWYLQHLQSRLQPLWNSLIVPTVAGLSEGQQYDDVSALTEAFVVLTEVANSLFGYGEVTMPDIVAHLCNIPTEDQTTEMKTMSLLRDIDGELAAHLAFQMTGWLTGLWEPLADVSCPSFKLAGSLPPRPRAGIRPDPILRNIELPIKEWQHQPLHRLAGRFGKLFPNPDLSLHDNTLGSRDFESACITANYICWYSLEDIVDVTLEWTATIGQHLEYNHQQKKLYVFKYPSICLLLSRDGPQTLLSDVFRQQQREQATSQPFSAVDQLELDGYLAEVMLSYRLLFACNRRSRNSIKRKLASLGEGCDTLLKTLCTAKEGSAEINWLYRELNAEPTENYVPIADFPFLAKKLIQLQKASMGRSPHSFRRLWYDRRNPSAWFALWAVLIITTLTLLFQLLQLVFQIYTPM